MTVDSNIAELVSEIEYVIGGECYNPNSYDGYRDEYGCSYRYPVSFRIPNNEEVKTRSKVPGYYADVVTPEIVRTLKYKFGSNQLHIGKAIIRVLEQLEERYGLNINALEEEHLKNKSDNKF